MALALLDDLAQVLGTELLWDSDGQCSLEFENGIEITLSLHEELISIRALLGAGNPNNLKTALSQQYRNPTLGFFMALDETSNQLFLMTVIDIENHDLIPEIVNQLVEISQEFKHQKTFSDSYASTLEKTIDMPTFSNDQGVMLP